MYTWQLYQNSRAQAVGNGKSVVLSHRESLMFRDYLWKNVPTEAQRKTGNNPHAQLRGTSNSMKLKVRILLHYTYYR